MHPLLLVLLLQAAPSDRDFSEARAVLVKGLDQFDRNVDEFATLIRTRFPADSQEPRTGMAVASSEETGADGFHAVTVVTVIEGSPAGRAGIRPGDRIVRVGARRLEHEPPQVVRLLTDGTAGPLELAVRRDDRELTVVVDRQPLACLQRSSERIDQKEWQKRIADMRRLSAMVRSGLDDGSVPAELRLLASKEHVVRLFGLFDVLGNMLASELMDATAQECRFLTEPFAEAPIR